MKNKRRKKLHSYIMFLLAVCILLGFLLDNLKDFFIGFFAGWNEMSNIEDARIMYGNLGQMIGWIIIGTSLITIGVCCYKSLRRKVTEPIERLANNMNEVREGNLTIRTLVDGDFEIIDMQELKSNNEYVSKIFHYVAEHLNEKISLKDVAKHVHLSKEYTAYIFKKETGMTFSTYVNEQKITLSKKLIVNENMTLNEISVHLNFVNYDYFSKTFKRYTGISPSEYRSISMVNKTQ